MINFRELEKNFECFLKIAISKFYSFATKNYAVASYQTPEEVFSAHRAGKTKKTNISTKLLKTARNRLKKLLKVLIFKC